MVDARCRGCGKAIIWAARHIPFGGRIMIPCDPKPPVYHVVGLWDDGTPKVELVQDHLVSHFATCSKANDFSNSKPKEAV